MIVNFVNYVFDLFVNDKGEIVPHYTFVVFLLPVISFFYFIFNLFKVFLKK